MPELHSASAAVEDPGVGAVHQSAGHGWLQLVRGRLPQQAESKLCASCLQGLNRLQRRDLVELLLCCSAGVKDHGVEELCAALHAIPWTRKNVAELLLPAARAPELRVQPAGDHKASRKPLKLVKSREISEECSFCESLITLETELCEAIGVGNHMNGRRSS